MRNLKRVLSLALACVMVIGMMVMTTGAADFDDAAEITNTEAVDVMAAIGVLEGDELGNFNPNDTLTREQGAKIICAMLMGPKNAAALTGANIFTDVSADRWSSGYIAYCVNTGILAGNGDGTFNPTGVLTDVAFGKMLLVALGYDAKIQGYVGGDWSTAIATDMIGAGINAGTVSGAAVTREKAAQMAFNTLKTPMVYYAGGKGTTVTTSDGTQVVVDAGTVTKVSAGVPNYDGGTNAYTEFCEEYFANLTVNTGARDYMGRPANMWSYQSLPVGTYAKAPAFTTVAAPKMPMGTAPKAADVVDTISKSLDDSTATLWINGIQQTYSTQNILIGSDVEIYLNLNGTVNKVVVTEYSAATVLAATATKVEKGTKYISISGVTPGYVKAEKVLGDTDLSKFDVVLYYKDTDDVYTIEKATSVIGTVDGVHSDKGLLVGGEYYNNSAITGATNTWAADYTNTYKFFLDHADRIVKAVKISDDLADNYVAIKDIAWVTVEGVDGGSYLEARIVKADGTTEVVKVASVDKVVPLDATSGTVSVTVAATKFYATNTGSMPAATACTNAGTTVSLNKGDFLAVTNTSGAAPIVDAYFGVDGDPANVATSLAKVITTGSIYAYELDKDGNYKLSTTANGLDTFTAVNATIKGVSDTANIGAPTNDSTVFVYAVTTNGNTKYTVYNGYSNAPKASGIATTARTIVVGNDGFAKLVYVATSTVAGTFDADLVYVADDANLAKKVGNQTVYVYDGLIINGVAGSMTLTNSSLTEGTMYVVSGSNAATGAKTLSTTLTNHVDTNAAQTGISANGGNTIVIGSSTYTYTDETVAYYIDEDGNSTQITADAIGLDVTDSVYVVVDQTVATKAVKIYVVEQTNAPSTLTVAVANGGTASNSGNLYATGDVAVTGATLGTTTIDVTPASDANMTYTYTIKGDSNASVAVTDGAYTTVAAADPITADTKVTITVTATDGFSGAQSVYTYTVTVAGA